jgi:hypothetical protein
MDFSALDLRLVNKLLNARQFHTTFKKGMMETGGSKVYYGWIFACNIFRLFTKRTTSSLGGKLLYHSVQ